MASITAHSPIWRSRKWWNAFPKQDHQSLRFSHWQESRSRENLEKKWVNFFSLELEKWFFISLFPLDFQELKKKILFLFSIYEILLSYSRSLLDFQDFEEKFLFLLSIFKMLRKNSLSLLDLWDFWKQFSFSSQFSRFLETNREREGGGLSKHLKRGW